MTTEITISEAIERYISSVKLSRSSHTASTYKNALNAFQTTLQDHRIVAEKDMLSNLTEDSIAWFAADLKGFAPTTERLYLTAVSGFFNYLAAEKLSEVNLPRIRLLIQQRARRPGVRLPQFPSQAIDQVLEYCSSLVEKPAGNPSDHLINLRDRAFLFTLADTGLRVHEACGLRRGDMDWNEGKAVIIGKGNRQDVVRFSIRSTKALQDYLHERVRSDGASGKSLSSLPIFSRHDKGAGTKVKPITTTTGRNIVAQRVEEALGIEAVGTITPHSFRHYFVTRVLRASGNLKLAQELARHRNITVTQRYAHLSNDELDKGYIDAIEDKE
jgi:site-specific recombinase XerD